MKLSRFQSPYDQAGNTNFGFTAGKSGVYIIQRKGKTVYIGFSSNNIYRTMYRHFQKWNGKQVVVTYYGEDRNDFKVRVILCGASKAAKLEKALIIKHKPKDNPNKLRGYTLNYREEKVYDEYCFVPALSNKILEAAPF